MARQSREANRISAAKSRALHPDTYRRTYVRSKISTRGSVPRVDTVLKWGLDLDWVFGQLEGRVPQAKLECLRHAVFAAQNGEPTSGVESAPRPIQLD